MRLDPELPKAESLIGPELHRRARDEREPFAARVLQQVVRQLLLERALVTRELLAIARRQEDHVLVRDVRARDRDDLALFHLLRELARQLNRLYPRLESPAKGPLDKGLQLRLEVP